MFPTAIRILIMKMNRIIGITMLLAIVVTQRVPPCHDRKYYNKEDSTKIANAYRNYGERAFGKFGK